MRVYTCEQMRVIEENADINGFSYVEMMESAGNACAEKIHSILSGSAVKTVTILCGAGKNGGDGYVIARNLSEKGYSVRIVLVNGMPAAYESKIMYSYLEDKPVLASDLDKNYATCVSSCISSAAVVDCIFGIGFHGQLNKRISDFFNDISQSKAKKIAVDIPSGLEGNSSMISSAYFDADYTLAITCLKPVHVLKPAAECCGHISLINIGIDDRCYEAVGSDVMVTAELSEICRFFKPRNPVSNKGDYGKLLCVAGSKNMQGAAVMAAQAAVNSGVGIVTSVFPDAAYSAIASKLTEPLTLGLKSTDDGFLSRDNAQTIIKMAEKSTAVLLGCGLGVNDDTVALTEQILLNVKKPIILDADGINAISSNINILKETSASVIITPHPGEMSRLTGMSVNDIESDRIKAAGSFAKEYGCIVVLKGANTLVASPSGSVYINRTGNAGMATGGSGDVLAGIISSFVCQSMSLQSAAIAGVYIHGLCGDTVRKKYSMRAVTPTKMIDEMAEVLSKFE